MTKAEAMSVGLLWICFSYLLAFEQTLSESMRRINDGLMPVFHERILLPLLMAISFWIASRRIVKGAVATRSRMLGESAVIAYGGVCLIAWPLISVASIVFSGVPATFKHSRSLLQVQDDAPLAMHLAVFACGILLLAWSEYRRTSSE